MEKINFEMELSRNWHWMWSTFYYNKKHFGFINSLIKVSGKFFSSLIKMIFFTIIFESKKRKIYFQRFSGLFNSRRLTGSDSKLVTLCSINSVFQINLFTCQYDSPNKMVSATKKENNGNNLGLNV